MQTDDQNKPADAQSFLTGELAAKIANEERRIRASWRGIDDGSAEQEIAIMREKLLAANY